jgi:hypothetical protein
LHAVNISSECCDELLRRHKALPPNEVPPANLFDDAFEEIKDLVKQVPQSAHARKSECFRTSAGAAGDIKWNTSCGTLLKHKTKMMSRKDGFAWFT